MKLFFYLSFIFLTLFLNVNCLDFAQHSEKSLNKCDRCKLVVDSFKEGLKRTARGKHEGGDAHWEESKLKNYAFSEIRFVDIQDHLCSDLSSSKDQCYSFAEEYESDIEEWFMNAFKIENTNANKKEDESFSLFSHLCHDISKSCCEDGYFGPNCERCPGYPDNVCNSRGFCEGNGTRTGSGNCKCFPSFSGKYCEKCKKHHFASGEMESKIDEELFKIPEKCTKCDRSCESTCKALGPKGCLVCAKGYQWDEEYGCADVNECQHLEVDPCSEQKYCVNTIGSYECFRCNSACLSCTGPGSDSCIECSEGYRKTGNTCFKIADSLPKILFIIPIIQGLIIYKFFNFWYASSFVIAYALLIKIFEENILKFVALPQTR